MISLLLAYPVAAKIVACGYYELINTSYAKLSPPESRTLAVFTITSDKSVISFLAGCLLY